MKKTITYFIFHHEFDEMGELSIMGNYFDVNFRRKYVKQIRRGVACEIAQKFEEWYKKMYFWRERHHSHPIWKMSTKLKCFLLLSN